MSDTATATAIAPAPDAAEAGRAFAAACAAAIERGDPDAVPDEVLGQVLAAAVRLHAEKVQAGGTPRPVGANSGVTITDVCIVATALLDEVSLEVFELAAWQSMSGIGRRAAQ